MLKAIPLNRMATVTVAASDASANAKILADYICDGTADDVQIQAAIDSSISTGGKVQLSAGTFTIADTIVMHGTPSSGTGIHLAGAGIGITVIKAVNSLGVNMIEWTPAVDEFFVQFTDFTLNGNKAGGATGHGFYVANDDGGNPNDMQCHNLFVVNVKGNGFHIADSWGFRIVNLISEFCDGYGISLAGSQAYVTNCFFAYNGDTPGFNCLFGASLSVITGNTFYDNGSNDFGPRFSSCQFSTVTGNNFRNFRAGAYAMRISGDCQGTVFSGNAYSDNGQGIEIDSSASGALVTGNSFVNNTLDVDITVGSTCSVYNNYGVDKPLPELRLETFKNTSGGQLDSGDVVVMAATGEVYDGTQMTTSTTAGDDLVLGVVVGTIADDANGSVAVRGKITTLKVDGTTDIAIGDFITTFTTAKIGQKAGAGDMAFAIALEAYTADDSNGVIDAIIITPKKL